jgi:hypothetical protein
MPASPPPQGRRLTREESVVLDYQLALERFVDDSVPGSREAFEMAHNAIRWLIMKDAAGLKDARRWVAKEFHKLDDPDEQSGIVIQIEWHVRMALGVRQGGGKWGDPSEAPRWLHGCLASRFRDKPIPSDAELADWLDRHSERTAKGKITTAGIVTNIVHQGKLFGTVRSRQQALQLVTKALDRNRHPRW